MSERSSAPELTALGARLEPSCGVIGLLSGDEFTAATAPFSLALLRAAGPRIGILLCADPKEAPRQERRAVEHFRALGAEPVTLDVMTQRQARKTDVPSVGGVFLGGGSPTRVLDCLAGSPFWDEILRRWAAGMAIAGSSAGAMALCEHCTEPEEGAHVPTRWRRGLGPVSEVALAVHVTSRPADWLRAIVRTAPVPILALDDRTGVLIVPGEGARVVGPGKARVLRSPRG
jgi:cyanophycinase-like exopeptidase